MPPTVLGSASAEAASGLRGGPARHRLPGGAVTDKLTPQIHSRRAIRTRMARFGEQEQRWNSSRCSSMGWGGGGRTAAAAAAGAAAAEGRGGETKEGVGSRFHLRMHEEPERDDGNAGPVQQGEGVAKDSVGGHDGDGHLTGSVGLGASLEHNYAPLIAVPW
jgi:hypothetical protein